MARKVISRAGRMLIREEKCKFKVMGRKTTQRKVNSAVSLQMLIHETFYVELPLELLREDMTLSELVTLLEKSDKISEPIDKFMGNN